MYFLDETLPTPEENLAFDEALIEVADRHSLEQSEACDASLNNGSTNEVLRVWELQSPCLVLGRASKWNEEVNSNACQRDSVPVLRRASGGASIVAGPGCLMYSALVSYHHRPSWRGLDVAHQEVMCKIRDAVQQTSDSFHLSLRIAIDGTCDLTINDRKFSGNAARCKRNWMLYHGTIMYSMPLEWLSDYLLEPPRQPEYRKKRQHGSFVTNLLEKTNSTSLDAFRQELKIQLAVAWNATRLWQSSDWREEVNAEALHLLNNRYLDPNWHRSR